MKTFKQYLIESTDVVPLLVQEFQNEHKHIHGLLDRDNCTSTSREFEQWLSEKHPNVMSLGVVPAGKVDNKTNRMHSGGFMRVDKLQYNYDDLTSKDKDEMLAQNLNPKSALHRKEFVQSHVNKENYHLIPHSWVETKTGILDPTAFHIDGKSGQFDKMIKDKAHAIRIVKN